MQERGEQLAQVLILGGRGRIGQSVAADLLQHTDALLLVTGRTVTGRTVTGRMAAGGAQ